MFVGEFIYVCYACSFDIEADSVCRNNSGGLITMNWVLIALGFIFIFGGLMLLLFTLCSNWCGDVFGVKNQNGEQFNQSEQGKKQQNNQTSKKISGCFCFFGSHDTGSKENTSNRQNQNTKQPPPVQQVICQNGVVQGHYHYNNRPLHPDQDGWNQNAEGMNYPQPVMHSQNITSNPNMNYPEEVKEKKTLIEKTKEVGQGAMNWVKKKVKPNKKKDGKKQSEHERSELDKNQVNIQQQQLSREINSHYPQPPPIQLYPPFPQNSQGQIPIDYQQAQLNQEKQLSMLNDRQLHHLQTLANENLK